MKDDGGPAFPEFGLQNYADGHTIPVEVCGGMTLRDYFAGQALAGMCAAPWEVIDTFNKTDVRITERAYHMADNMLRIKTGQPTVEWEDRDKTLRRRESAGDAPE